MRRNFQSKSSRITDATRITDGVINMSLQMGNLNTIPDNPSKIISTQHLRLFVGTWNVGGRAPTTETRESMQEWLMGSSQLPDEPADIYVIGFQEIVPLHAGNVLGMNFKDGNDAGLLASNKWEALISATLNKCSSCTSCCWPYSSNSIYFDSADTANLIAQMAAITTIGASADPILRDKNDCAFALFDRQHNGHEGANTKIHDQCECTDGTSLPDHNYRTGERNSDNSNTYKIHQQDDTLHQNIQYMRHCAFGSVTNTPPFSEKNHATPSSSADRYGMYTTPRALSTRGTEIEADLHFGASADSRCMYTRIARKHMVGLLISVWVRRELQHDVQAVQVSSVGCGIMNCLGNKGSVSVSLSVHDTRFCFICSHLRSGNKPGDVSRRNSDVNKILQKTRFYGPEKLRSNASLSPTTILAHDRIVWLGDLNYRLTLAANEIRDFLIREDWKDLIESDELKREKGVGGVFEGWHEGEICFAPTYKYRINSDTYAMLDAKDGCKRRTPAWCDRILWHGKGLKQLSYTRCESKHSDHRPLKSFFMVEVESLRKTSGLTAHHLTSQSIEPFLVEVKELLSTKNLNVNQIMLSKYNSFN